MQPVSILIIDDQYADRLATRAECRKVFREETLVIDEAETIDAAISKMAERIYQIILLDKDLGVDADGDQISGIDQIRLLQEIQPVSKVIMLTASEKLSEISRALRQGVYDYIIKGADEERAAQREAALQRAFKSSMDGIDRTVRQQSGQQEGIYSDFICLSPAMVRFDQKIKAVADSNHPALLLGPSGIGKGAVARRIHEYRTKSLGGDRPFVNINIGAMPDELAQAELFGQDPFSFTGAGTKTKTGLLDVAKNGDIFLDEVGDVSPEMQLRLLKVVEEREYIRVGGRQPIKTNARFIFATNKNIAELVAQGKFREDLYMRIAALELQVPSLEDRKEDLPAIIESICARIRKANSEKKIYSKDLPEDFFQYLMRDHIPGNVRGIQNSIERFATFASFDRHGFPDYKKWKTVLGVEDGTKKKARGQLLLSDIQTMETNFLGQGYAGMPDAQSIFERKLIEEAFARYGNQTQAAKHLKISASALSVRMKRLNMRKERGHAKASTAE